MTTLDATICRAMEISEVIADAVLSSRTNEEAIRAAESLLVVLHRQADLVAECGNVVPLLG